MNDPENAYLEHARGLLEPVKASAIPGLDSAISLMMPYAVAVLRVAVVQDQDCRRLQAGSEIDGLPCCVRPNILGSRMQTSGSWLPTWPLRTRMVQGLAGCGGKCVQAQHNT